jgi:transposase-like protein
LNIAEPVEERSTVGAEGTAPSTEGSGSGQDGATHGAGSAARSPRRRLDAEQEREIARLYADGSTSTAAIRERFGIGESSLYRIVQRQGIPLRGRGVSAKPSAPPQRPAPTGRQRRSASAGSAPPAPGRPRSTAATTGRSGSGAAPRRPSGATTSPSGPAANVSVGRGHRFRISFQGEMVVEAQGIRDALRQVEALGATEITAITRDD